ncbi:lanthionine synthetase C family protein [Tenacibaculum ovolyticum]|uniref:lanthionine synthetase C family protein n=1 Tax=Tenacibaculum ovolyticum TaxID=104270 RepID=UPI003BABE869
MLKKNLEKKLNDIYEIVISEYDNNNNIGILTGLSSLSLFVSYYFKYKGFKDDLLIESVIINSSVAKINKGYNFPTFCTGIAGLGWSLDHLEQENLVNTECDKLLPNFDDYLYDVMISDLRINKYDYLHGAIGYAFYFLKRYRNTKSDILKIKYTKILLEFIKLLGESAKTSSKNTLKWSSFFISKKENNYNLSLSHGMSSIIGILTKLYEHDDFKESTEKILKGAINYVLKFKKFDLKNKSIFPNAIPIKGEIEYNSRLAWCYGDLGIGVRLWYASKVLKDNELKDISLKILKDSAKRRVSENTLVVDASICHGSFGIAQVYNSIYRETKIDVFKETSEFWIKDGLSKAIFKDGFAGYKQWRGNDSRLWSNEVSLLEGVSGIGLVILDYLMDENNNWDECLMIS